jgi:hypothetical protein
MLSISNVEVQKRGFWSTGSLRALLHITEYSPLVEGDDFTVDDRFVWEGRKGFCDGRVAQ